MISIENKSQFIISSFLFIIEQLIKTFINKISAQNKPCTFPSNLQKDPWLHQTDPKAVQLVPLTRSTFAIHVNRRH